MPSVTYDKDQRDKAKQDGIPLVCFDFDGRHCKRMRATTHGQMNAPLAIRGLEILVAEFHRAGLLPKNIKYTPPKGKGETNV
jgi:hypothetical protein